MCGILKEMSQQVDDDDNNFVLRIKQKNFFFVFSPSFEVCLYFNSFLRGTFEMQHFMCGSRVKIN